MRLTDEQRRDLEWWFASYLDRPSVYMGGPSPPSRRKARELADIVERVLAGGSESAADSEG